MQSISNFINVLSIFESVLLALALNIEKIYTVTINIGLV